MPTNKARTTISFHKRLFCTAQSTDQRDFSAYYLFEENYARLTPNCPVDKLLLPFTRTDLVSPTAQLSRDWITRLSSEHLFVEVSSLKPSGLAGATLDDGEGYYRRFADAHFGVPAHSK